MSASLIVLIPVVLLGLVTALCFVGCGFSTHGLGFGPYGDPITQTMGNVACWPLDDTVESLPTARNIANVQFGGTYPDVPMGDNSFKIQQPGIVFGAVDNGLTPCAFFNGSFVTVDFHQELNPAPFTLEAWVKPNWKATDPQVARAVLVSANSTPAAGYALLATTDNFWEIQIGIADGTFFPLKSGEPILLDPPTPQYLAVTFDGSLLTLFVGVAGIGAPIVVSTQAAPPAKFVPELSMSSPSTSTPLFIGMGRPDTTGGMFPFDGFIEYVAIYNTALDPSIIQNHFALGSTPPG